MQIVLTEHFQRDFAKLSPNERNDVIEAVLRLPVALKDIHQHSGLGIRKIHSSGIFEVRAGLKLRIVFGYRQNTAVLERVGNHDDIHRYLKSL